MTTSTDYTSDELTSVAQSIVKEIDPGAFITVDEIQPLQRGYFRH